MFTSMFVWFVDLSIYGQLFVIVSILGILVTTVVPLLHYVLTRNRVQTVDYKRTWKGGRIFR